MSALPAPDCEVAPRLHPANTSTGGVMTRRQSARRRGLTALTASSGGR